jgi:hypothetical protein
LTARLLTGPLAATWGFTMSRIVTFEPKTGRSSRSRVRYASLRFLSLTQRLELLKQHKVRAARLPRQHYRASVMKKSGGDDAEDRPL